MDSSQALRLDRLSKLFENILRGRDKVGKQNYTTFLEAMCTQPDPPTCINKICSSSCGLSSLQSAMRVELSPTFCNGRGAEVIQYLTCQELTVIGGGELLKQVLLAIVEPSFFWSAYVTAFRQGKLSENSQHAFAWLLLQLVSLPDEQSVPYRELAEDGSLVQALLGAPVHDVRVLGERIKHVLELYASGTVLDEQGPGGRHDNDKVNFREISILPTADEITSREAPFLRTSSALDHPDGEGNQVADYLDNQFRLLREDMLYEMREELDIAMGRKRKNHRNFPVDGLRLQDVFHAPADPSNMSKRDKWSISLQRMYGFPQFKSIAADGVKKRISWLKDNRWFLKHGSMVCILIDDELVGFATLRRDEDLLAQKLPIIVLQLEGQATTVKALIRLKSAKTIKLLQIDTALFAFEPILKALQHTTTFPLNRHLIFWDQGESSPLQPQSGLVKSILRSPGQDLGPLLGVSKPIVLDKSQSSSLVMGLTHSVSLIQGPPGTGKSFIGALLAKALHDNSETILVVCYTNHALDQFLEDLLDIGIPEASLVRLGSNSTPRTDPISLFNLTKSSNFRFGRGDWTTIDNHRKRLGTYEQALKGAADRFQRTAVRNANILEYLEFEAPDFYRAFLVPKAADGMRQVTRKGKEIQDDFLFYQWSKGYDAGLFKNHDHVKEATDIWQMPLESRLARIASWKHELLKEQALRIHTHATDYNSHVDRLDHKFDQRNREIIASKRIIGCTTTAAAKYREAIKAAAPTVLLVEEAGEILESHIITALGSKTQKLVLIGDHKQLRPKVNNYKLTVEKGEGYDLNRSLFERLVIKGLPHETLQRQHRMRPEISALVRHLTYADLSDAPSTLKHPDLLGVQDNVVFIHHEKPEDDLREASVLGGEDEVMGSKSSKRNAHEVSMVLKILRYLGQQGYGTDKVVILTPYLGQLRALQQALKEDNDPVLNDLDSADLVRAGLVTEAAAKLTRKPIRLATIDNYQGEESDIVIVSLTRSNPEHNIGFMSSGERVNVMLSRARNALIVIGNADTFQHARKGSEVWQKLILKLRADGHIYNGLPVKCERHPTRRIVLASPDDFDTHAPEGGCTRPCGAKLRCGHICVSRCHQIYDHSKMACSQILYSKCSKGHDQQWQCPTGTPDSCVKCDKDHKDAEIRKNEEFARKEKREREERAHARKLLELESRMKEQQEKLRDAQLAQERNHAIERKRRDLEDITKLAQQNTHGHGIDTKLSVASESPVCPPRIDDQSTAASSSQTSVVLAPTQPSTAVQTPVSNASSGTATGKRTSSAEEEWQRQKTIDGESNEAIDAIMEMTGLAAVKSQILSIKAKVDIARRQGVPLKDRCNFALVGNPGTGKTTVARHFARFLASAQVITGNQFVEVTGSGLANEGVPGIKKRIEGILEAGGGTLFCDEAYQLTARPNAAGSQVMDYLLAEMENHLGKISFIFAGYNKEMETFFDHNPGLTSRVPYKLRFEDYSNEELMDMMVKKIDKDFSGRMKVEGDHGIRGLYGRIAIRRLGRGRGHDGFGNARALENLLSAIRERQARRVQEGRRAGRRADDLLLVKEDLIGPDPSTVMSESAELKKLDSMIGLSAVKKSVQNLFSMVKTNYERELDEKAPIQLSLNRCFVGPPGTGKTTVSKLYGAILANLGMISNGEVVVKNPADFIGSALGQSESQTKAILANTVGKVLVIDEAYMLYGGSNGGVSDPYKTAVIDTIVAEVQSVPGEDRCVLLLGYKDQMEEMFQNVNPGLSRRFAIEDAFVFEDYTDAELRKALDWKLKDQDLLATDAAKDVATDVLSRARNRPNFGNIGEVENLLTAAKVRYQERQAAMAVGHRRGINVPLEPQDFDPDYQRAEHAATHLAKLFEDVVGCDAIVAQLSKYQQIARNAKSRGREPRDLVPTNFVFKGPPGTGKTTTARKISQVYFDMGFLSSTEVIESSASDLVGQYVGQTGPKTKKLLEKALGRVLFIDEAYRLSEGHFAKEAVDELVGLLTQDAYRGRLIVVLAGYDNEMNELLAVNPGLSSRFPHEIQFYNLNPAQCLEILRKELAKNLISVDALDDVTIPEYGTMEVLLADLSALPSWGNARDVKTLSRDLVGLAFETCEDASAHDGRILLSSLHVIDRIKAMLDTQRRRHIPAHSARTDTGLLEQILAPDRPTARRTSTRTVQSTCNAPPPPSQELQGKPDGPRDPGVSDAVWAQLQADKAAEEETRARALRELDMLEQECERRQQREEESRRELEELEQSPSADDLEDSERKRRHEAARLRELEAKTARARIAKELEEKRKEEERQRKEEAKVQAKLREMGVCVAGFRWIKQQAGYRCAGGAHFIDNASLGLSG
ncbi:P-loop containing nucleoside triphosphate hydrolase protein [Punctularia strigosozonata HHB-11173 SS5]|uniref:P-loop containing nucleoside triphosphate hydrolase protein n=1 Tax=Punctularia strigosozonata (strain HHB-11173) TaxID=741275 RepID=UPI0004418549|nr:P-loop containing nucleoside triphosphate hydrolase protein [Punctularia strigosozonata HHB-11173 SS5]EIN07312.1 P-loop containing nucleoside triphosphate hydrolase protein [Punctularia strigosozonata HHB-11173 SS5]